MRIKKIKSSALIIAAGFWIIFILFSIFYLIAFLNVSKIKSKLDDITATAFPTVKTGDDLIITLQRANKLTREMLLANDLNKIIYIEEEFKKVLKQNQVAKEKIFELSGKDPDLKRKLIRIEKEIIGFMQYAESLFNDHRSKIIGKKFENISAIMKNLDRRVKSTTKEINRIIQYADNILLKADKNANIAIVTTNKIMLFLFIFMVSIGFGVSFWIIRKISLYEEMRENAYHEIDQIWNSASIGMWLIDREENIIRVNETLLNMLKLRKGDIIGNKFHIVWQRLNCKDDMEMFKKALDNNKKYEYEKTINLNSEYTALLVKSVPFLSNTGEVIGVLESFVDITEKKSIEKEIMNAIETERQRIGQDIHDSLGQKLTGLSYITQAVRNSLKEKSFSETKDLEESINIIHELIDHTRKLSKGLHPINLEKFGLISAVKELALDSERIFNISINLDLQDNISINDNDIITNLYYIISESINNSIKHGNAKNIRLSLRSEGQYLILSIKDDGEKKDNDKAGHNQGIGLRIMKYRAGIIDAEYDSKQSEEGYVVTVKLKIT